jgi:hypothetical protein
MNHHFIPEIGDEISCLWFGDHCLQLEHLPVSTAWVFFKYFESYFDYCFPFVQEDIAIRRSKDANPKYYPDDFYRYEVAERIFALHGLDYVAQVANLNSNFDFNPYSNPNTAHEEFHEHFQASRFEPILSQGKEYPVLHSGSSSSSSSSGNKLFPHSASSFYESYDCEMEVDLLLRIRAWFIKGNNCMFRYTIPMDFTNVKLNFVGCRVPHNVLPPGVGTVVGVPDFSFLAHYEQFVPQYSQI